MFDNFFNHVPGERAMALDKGSRINEAVRGLTVKHNPIGVDARDLMLWFKYDRNEEKGETIDSELKKWLKSIEVMNHIIHRYDHVNDMYIFVHKLKIH